MTGDRLGPSNRATTAEAVGLALVLPTGTVSPDDPVAHFQQWLGAALRTPDVCCGDGTHRAADEETTVGRGGACSP